MTPLAPVPGPLLPSPYHGDKAEEPVMYSVMTIAFLVTKAGVITAAPGGGSEAQVLARVTSDDLKAVWGA